MDGMSAWLASSSLLRRASTWRPGSLHRRLAVRAGEPAESQKYNVKSEDEEFRTFEIPGLKPKVEAKKKSKRKLVPPPRYQKMKVDQDWKCVWPAAATFRWSVVPFPVRQGLVQKSVENEGIPPGRYANAELMKIPNFLHLTPAHIKTHCAAIKKFCTPWPQGLETDKKCKKHFPIEVISADYCFSGPSVHDERARAITLKLNICQLDLDYHARDKLLRLVGDRYDKFTNELTLIAERCPLKKQNYDYLMYVLTALYHESWRVEPWEAEKTEADMEKYFWDRSRSRQNIVDLLKRIKEIDAKRSEKSGAALDYLPDDISEEKLLNLSKVVQYQEAVSELINEGESLATLNKYKASVKELFNLHHVHS